MTALPASNRPSAVHLTFDIDWAPDWVVASVLQTLAIRRTHATFFVTHKSDMIDELIAQGHNVGIHPNFLPESTQGSSWQDVMHYLLTLCPQAVTMRTHGLVQSTPLLQLIAKRFPQIQYDMSLFTPQLPICRLIPWRLESETLSRINYHWEDDICFYDPMHNWQELGLCGSITIYDYHPIHVVLNSTDGSEYRALKGRLGPAPMTTVSHEDVRDLKANTVPGTQTHLELLLDSKLPLLSFDELLCELG